jgi:hypothetical protein
LIGSVAMEGQLNAGIMATARALGEKRDKLLHWCV